MSNMATTDGAVITTVPAGRNWIGSMVLSASQALGAGGSATASRPSVTVSGAGGNYGDGDTVVAVALALPAVAVTALVGASTANSACTGPINIQARENPVDVILHVPAGVTAVATASGALQ